MTPNSFSLFRFNVIKDAETISSSYELAAMADKQSKSTFVIHAESEFIIRLRETAYTDTVKAREMASQWLSAQQQEISGAQNIAVQIRALLQRAKDGDKVQTIIYDRLSQAGIEPDIAHNINLLGDALVATSFTQPQHSKRISDITRALQIYHFLQRTADSNAGVIDREVLSRSLNQTPIIPMGIISRVRISLAQPAATNTHGLISAEPVSYQMVAELLTRLRTHDLTQLVKVPDTQQETEGGGQASSLFLSQSIIESFALPVRKALEDMGIMLESTPFPLIVEQLKVLRRRLYQFERRLMGMTPGQKFQPGVWQRTDQDGWVYILPPSLTNMLAKQAGFSAGGRWAYLHNLGGWVAIVGAEAPVTTYLGADDISTTILNVLGVTDLLIVEQKRVRYQASEIAHIENVLEGEQFKRSHRKFTRIEELLETETEVSEENERDIQSSEKFELEKEVSSLIKEEQKINLGTRVSASYGPWVSVETEFGLENLSSSEQAQRTASHYTSSLTERAVTRIRERMRELRQIRTVSETEETNEHGISRGTTDGNLSGVYQWVDKIYELQTMNYGKRLMLEAYIPEPGAYLRYLRTQRVGSSSEAPPEPFTITAEDITEDNYTDYAAIWQVGDINPPPDEYQVVGVAAKARVSSTGHVHYTGQIKTPKGYACYAALASLHRGQDVPQPNDDPLFTLAGNHSYRSSAGHYRIRLDSQLQHGELPFTMGTWYLPEQVKEIPFSITALGVCTVEHMDEWRLATFNALLQGYLRLKAEYDESAAAAEQGIAISGAHPNINRENELLEVRKLCMETISNSHFIPFSATEVNADGSVHINFEATGLLAGNLVFFEDAFEWENTAYDLYPYYWSGTNHVDLKLLDDPDPAHLSFLRAGAAKVKIPVRPGHERNVLYYLDFGSIYNGEGQAPVAEERLPLLADIEAFVTTQVDAGEALPFGEPWLARVPTTFVTLRTENGLPGDWIKLSENPDNNGNSNGNNSGNSNGDGNEGEPNSRCCHWLFRRSKNRC